MFITNVSVLLRVGVFANVTQLLFNGCIACTIPNYPRMCTPEEQSYSHSLKMPSRIALIFGKRHL